MKDEINDKARAALARARGKPVTVDAADLLIVNSLAVVAIELLKLRGDKLLEAGQASERIQSLYNEAVHGNKEGKRKDG